MEIQGAKEDDVQMEAIDAATLSQDSDFSPPRLTTTSPRSRERKSASPKRRAPLDRSSRAALRQSLAGVTSVAKKARLERPPAVDLDASQEPIEVEAEEEAVVIAETQEHEEQEEEKRQPVEEDLVESSQEQSDVGDAVPDTEEEEPQPQEQNQQEVSLSALRDYPLAEYRTYTLASGLGVKGPNIQVQLTFALGGLRRHNWWNRLCPSTVWARLILSLPRVTNDSQSVEKVLRLKPGGRREKGQL